MWITRVRATSVPAGTRRPPRGPARRCPRDPGRGFPPRPRRRVRLIGAGSAWPGGTSLPVSSGVISATVASMASNALAAIASMVFMACAVLASRAEMASTVSAGFSCPGLEAAQGAGLQGIDGFDGFDGLERPGLDHRGLEFRPAEGGGHLGVRAGPARQCRGVRPGDSRSVAPPPGDSAAGVSAVLGSASGSRPGRARRSPADRRYDRGGIRVSRGRRCGTQFRSAVCRRRRRRQPWLAVGALARTTVLAPARAEPRSRRQPR